MTKTEMTKQIQRLCSFCS